MKDADAAVREGIALLTCGTVVLLQVGSGRRLGKPRLACVRLETSGTFQWAWQDDPQPPRMVTLVRAQPDPDFAIRLTVKAITPAVITSVTIRRTLSFDRQTCEDTLVVHLRNDYDLAPLGRVFWPLESYGLWVKALNALLSVSHGGVGISQGGVIVSEGGVGVSQGCVSVSHGAVGGSHGSDAREVEMGRGARPADTTSTLAQRWITTTLLVRSAEIASEAAVIAEAQPVQTQTIALPDAPLLTTQIMENGNSVASTEHHRAVEDRASSTPNHQADTDRPTTAKHASFQTPFQTRDGKRWDEGPLETVGENGSRASSDCAKTPSWLGTSGSSAPGSYSIADVATPTWLAEAERKIRQSTTGRAVRLISFRSPAAGCRHIVIRL